MIVMIPVAYSCVNRASSAENTFPSLTAFVTIRTVSYGKCEERRFNVDRE